MAKVPKVKKKGISVHSRAARRAAPDQATDVKSKTATATSTEESSDYKPWLHAAQGAGIQKRLKKKPLTRGQKLRQQKGLEKAEQDTAKLEKKVADSKKRGSRTQERAAGWEELNEKLVVERERAERKGRREGVKGRKGMSGGGGGGDDVLLPDLEAEVSVAVQQTGGTAASPPPPPPPAVSDATPSWASMHATDGDFVDDIR